MYFAVPVKLKESEKKDKHQNLAREPKKKKKKKRKKIWYLKVTVISIVNGRSQQSPKNR